ncbi:Phosphoenolpyruvate synthase [Salmonella enterica subsp. enterica serovar Give str. S5-487]|nr:Phosphoenolpyruvate synthase [Salmonella enterica subsp. enterica serovar Give str. S5-487]
MSNNGSSPLVLWYNQLGMNDVDRVGGKNASLGEMITNLSGMGVSVPNGFATTADAFNQFLDQSGVNQRIYELLDKTDIDDVSQLAKAGAQIRQWIIDTPFQPELIKIKGYHPSFPAGAGKRHPRCLCAAFVG